MNLLKMLKRGTLNSAFLKRKTKLRDNKKGKTMRKLISDSFFLGYIRALDLKGTKRWPNLSDEKKRDYDAIRGDWEDVGREIRKGTQRYSESNR